MPVPMFDGDYLVFRERALAAFFVFANHLLIIGDVAQLADFEDGDCYLVPLIFAALDMYLELLVANHGFGQFRHGFAVARIF